MSDYVHPAPAATIADHTPVEDEWLIGARTVTETREQCAKCDCDNFEEIPNDWHHRPDAAVEAAARLSREEGRSHARRSGMPLRRGFVRCGWTTCGPSSPQPPHIAAQALKDMGEWFDRAAQLGTGERDVIAAQACYDRAAQIEADHGLTSDRSCGT